MRGELELRHLRVFAAVVEAGTHTRAARTLGVSQSTVSETLRALEHALGVEFFRKQTQGSPTLTPAGEVLLEYSRRMFALCSELGGALAQASTEIKARLVVSAVESIGAYVLPSRLAALRARWPGVRVEVLTGSCAEIRERVAAGASDLGLVLEPEATSTTGAILARARLMILGAPSHPAARGAGPSVLGRSEFLMCDAGGNYHQALRRHFEAAGLAEPRLQAMGTIEGVKRGILAGGTALGLLPEHAVEAELRDGLLVEVRVKPPLPSVVLCAVLAPGAPRSPLVDDLVDTLSASLLTVPAASSSIATARRSRNPRVLS